MLIECLERIHATWEAKQRQLCTEDRLPIIGQAEETKSTNQIIQMAALNHSINNDSLFICD